MSDLGFDEKTTVQSQKPRHTWIEYVSCWMITCLEWGMDEDYLDLMVDDLSKNLPDGALSRMQGRRIYITYAL